MSGERFTLDTNILIYSVQPAAGPRYHLAVEIVERAANTACCLTLQAISEFFHAVTRKQVLGRQRASEIARLWLDVFPVVGAGPSSIRTALATSVAGQTSYWDGLLIATAAEAGCEAILTEDMADGTLLSGVRIINPFAGEGLSPPAAALLGIASPSR